jgi:hypothetical protein
MDRTRGSCWSSWIGNRSQCCKGFPSGRWTPRPLSCFSLTDTVALDHRQRKIYTTVLLGQHHNPRPASPPMRLLQTFSGTKPQVTPPTRTCTMESTLNDYNASPLLNLHHRAAPHAPVALSVLNRILAGLLHRPLLQLLVLSTIRIQILSTEPLQAPLLSIHIPRCRPSQPQRILKMMSSSLGVNPKRSLMCAVNAARDSPRGLTCGGMTRSIPERNRFPAVFLAVVPHLSKYVSLVMSLVA